MKFREVEINPSYIEGFHKVLDRNCIIYVLHAAHNLTTQEQSSNLGISTKATSS